MAEGTITAGAIITGAFDIIADLIAIVDYFTSTLDPEVHEIYGYTFDTRENLKKIMEKLGVTYEFKPAKDIQNRLEKTTEFFKESRASRIDATLRRDEAYSLAAKSAVEDAKKLYWDAMDFLKEYPFLLSTPLVGEAATPTEEGQAKAERDKISGEVKQVGDKVEEMKLMGGGGAATGFAGTAIFTLILASLERIEGKMTTEQTTGGELGEEKTGEENIDGGGIQIVESITSRIDRLEEAQERKLQKIEDNILFRITSLIDLIKKSSMPFKEIYDRLCKQMLYEWRNRSR
ncbi:MAG: hypothetical protein JW984_15475 [Deltaproteobacteria bacterium]|uniref:Uncharacterized protein n=1 Tax=Candidatus Zymogenus saltonus TaxID=2844893 RepID=A0A9D8KHH5_9DELT|nr:hypothetical protein [Candidatus Zymogenus saltonus]